MNIFATRPAPRRRAALALSLSLATAGPAPADPLEWRGEATLAVRAHVLESPFDDDDRSSFFDQYRHLSHRDADVPVFADLVHADVGLYREDGTHLLRLRRVSPWAWNERTALSAGTRGLRLEGRHFRYRSDELRVFPEGTGAGGAFVFPVLGSAFRDDVPADDRFFVRRFGGGAALRLRPAELDLPAGPIDALELRSRFEHRSGWRQDRFLVDTLASVVLQDERFRGVRRRLDQDLVAIGAGLVVTPLDLATAALDVSFERFREDADTLLLRDLAARSPSAFPILGAADQQRALRFVPDTDRISGALRVSRRLGGATLHAGAFATHLAQVERRSPRQERAGLDDVKVTTWSAHAAADVPLGERVSANAYTKTLARHNKTERDTALFGPANRTQVDAFQEDRWEWAGGGELAAAPWPGARLAVGYRGRYVDRGLRFPSVVDANGVAQQALVPGLATIDDVSEQHTAYARGHARLVRGVRLSGEAGVQWAPQIGLPRELERAAYARARAGWLVPRPVPATLALFGSFLTGENDEIELVSDTSGRSQRKDFERLRYDWGATLSAAPREGLAVYAVFTHHHDEQELAHVRSDLPRYFGPALVRFFRDSTPRFESDLRTLRVGVSAPLAPGLELSLAGGLTRVRASFTRGGGTASVLEETSELDSSISSLEAALALELSSDVRLGLGYRTDAYHDRARIESLNLSTREHAVTLSATIDLALFTR